MIKLFQKRSVTRIKEVKWTDKAATKVAGVLLGMQAKISIRLNKIFAKTTRQKIKIALIVFCLLSGGFSIYIATDAVISPRNRVTHIDKIATPPHATIGNDENKIADSVSDEMYTAIQLYTHYMDSLGLVMRPGLADSIRVIEEIYQSQKNK